MSMPLLYLGSRVRFAEFIWQYSIENRQKAWLSPSSLSERFGGEMVLYSNRVLCCSAINQFS